MCPIFSKTMNIIAQKRLLHCGPTSEGLKRVKSLNKVTPGTAVSPGLPSAKCAAILFQVNKITKPRIA